MVSGRKTPRDRDDSQWRQQPGRAPGDDSDREARLRGHENKKRAPAKSAALGLVRKRPIESRGPRPRRARAPAARKRDGGAAKSARAALAARLARSGDAGRLLLTDEEKARTTKSGAAPGRL